MRVECEFSTWQSCVLFTFAFRLCLAPVNLGLRLNEIHFPLDKYPLLTSLHHAFNNATLNLLGTGNFFFGTCIPFCRIDAMKYFLFLPILQFRRQKMENRESKSIFMLGIRRKIRHIFCSPSAFLVWPLYNLTGRDCR